MKNDDKMNPWPVYSRDDLTSDLADELPIQYRYDADVLDSGSEAPDEEADLLNTFSGEDEPGMEWIQKRNHLVNHFARMNRKKRARDNMLVII